MSTGKDISLNDGTKLKCLPKSYKYFMNKTTILYGPRESGKSTLIEEIIYLCKDHIPVVFLVLGTNVDNSGAFSNRIPKTCIKNSLDKEWLEQVLQTQKGRAKCYNIANDIVNLESLFKKLNQPNLLSIENNIIQKSKEHVDSVQNNSKLNYSEKTSETASINSIKNETLIELYKKAIRTHRLQLEKMNNEDLLSKNEQICLQFTDFKPHMMLIFDDCAAKIKSFVKTSDTLKEIFYNGRHWYFSLVLTAQDDKEIETELRKNTAVSIFTNAQVAKGNFEKTSNSFSKSIRRKVEYCIEKVFHPVSDGQKNYKKLVYTNFANNQDFYYTIAEIHGEFRVGAPHLWDLHNKIVELSKDNENDDRFFDKYLNI